MARFGSTRGGYVRLADGYEMPLFGLGTYKITSQKDMDRAVDAALKNGYRLFDTAYAYGNEKQLGEALQKMLPEYGLTLADVFITTKVPILNGSDKKERTYEVVCESLKKLQMEAIDLVLVHYPREWTGSDKNAKNKEDRMEVYQALEKCKEEGKVRSIGVSNYEIRHFQELLQECRFRPAVNQCEYHPFCCRKELVEYCRQQEIFFEAFTSLARQDPKLYENEVVTAIAESRKISVSHVLLSFALSQNIGVIPKSTNAERIADNIEVVGTKLTRAEIDDLLSLNKTHNYTDCSPWDVL